MNRLAVPVLLMSMSDDQQYIAIPATPINAAMIKHHTLIAIILVAVGICIGLGAAYGFALAKAERRSLRRTGS